MSQAGKGSKPRPVKKDVYNQRYDEIDWSDKPKREKVPVDNKQEVDNTLAELTTLYRTCIDN